MLLNENLGPASSSAGSTSHRRYGDAEPEQGYLDFLADVLLKKINELKIGNDAMNEHLTNGHVTMDKLEKVLEIIHGGYTDEVKRLIITGMLTGEQVEETIYSIILKLKFDCNTPGGRKFIEGFVTGMKFGSKNYFDSLERAFAVMFCQAVLNRRQI